MKKAKELSLVYIIGAVGYSIIELLWRGFTHWTMTLTGGACFVFVHLANIKLRARRLWERCLIGSGIITAVEFLVGCVVNIALKWKVWDYSRMRLNIMGQICLLYSVLWFFLCMPMCGISKAVNKRLKRRLKG